MILEEVEIGSLGAAAKGFEEEVEIGSIGAAAKGFEEEVEGFSIDFGGAESNGFTLGVFR